MTRLVCALIVLGAALIACARVEGTNRQQLLLTSAGQENQLGSDAYAEIKQKEKLCTDAATVAWVERVARRVAAMAPERGFQYEFVVIESPTVNAFCLPGGKVAVYTGILPYCQNEAGLATVLGHEIAHAIARHGGERMSQGMVTQLGGQTLDMVLKAKGVDPTISNMALTAFGVGSQIGVMLPFSRAHESEADALGLTYMAKAGYDPAEAVLFWQRFGAISGSGGTPSFLNTHPASADRAHALASQQADAKALYNAAPEKFGIGEAVPAAYAKPGKG